MAAAAEVRERLNRLERVVGTPDEGGEEDLVSQCVDVNERLLLLQTSHDELVTDLEERFNHYRAEKELVAEKTEARFRALEEEIALLKRVIVNGPDSSPSNGKHSKLKIPEPKPYAGARDAKEVENFLWDLETYFQAAGVTKEEQVSVATMFLTGDAKLWWRTRASESLHGGRPKVTSWEMLKGEIKLQFLPSNTAWVAREALKGLRQRGSAREYVREFNSLMLDINNMSEEDRLFNFLSGLRPEAQIELRRQGVRDLSSAIAAAEALGDFDQRGSTSSPPKERRPADGGKGGFKNRRKKPAEEGATDKLAMKGDGSQRQLTRGGCFACGGPHLVRNCPKKGALSAVVTQQKPEEKKSDEPGSPKVNPIQLLNSISAGKLKPLHGGLMHVEALINEHEVCAMLDTGATHNFLSLNEARRLGVKVMGSASRVKAVNSAVASVHGMVEVCLKIGTWEGKCKMMIVDLDDFAVILGVDFFCNAKVTLMPHLHCILINDCEQPCFIRVKEESQTKEPADKVAMKTECGGSRKGKEVLLAAMVLKKLGHVVDGHKGGEKTLKKSADRRSASVPKGSPSRGAKDHNRRSTQRARRPTEVPHRGLHSNVAVLQGSAAGGRPSGGCSDFQPSRRLNKQLNMMQREAGPGVSVTWGRRRRMWHCEDAGVQQLRWRSARAPNFLAGGECHMGAAEF